MAISKTASKEIERAVKSDVKEYINKKKYSKIKAINTVISNYEKAIKNPPKWSKLKKAQYIAEYKKGIATAKKLRKSKNI